VFGTEDGREALMTIPHVASGITGTKVEDYMDAVISSDLFHAGLSNRVGAKIIETDTAVLF
jgi:hypothetical protein